MVTLITFTSPRFRQGKRGQEKSSDLLMATELAGREKLFKAIGTSYPIVLACNTI